VGAERQRLALLERWLTGWSRSRGLPLPSHVGGGLTVEVGWPDQVRRYLFTDAGADLRACAAHIHAPFIFVKATVDAAVLRRALPARWSIQAPGYLMTRTGPMTAAVTLPARYRVVLSVEHGGYVLRVIDDAGALAATGRIVLAAGTAVFDKIETMEDYRRRGLASVVMLTLDRLAIQAGVTERLLVATAEGARLYQQLGWQHLAPFSTAVLAV